MGMLKKINKSEIRVIKRVEEKIKLLEKKVSEIQGNRVLHLLTLHEVLTHLPSVHALIHSLPLQ